MFESRDVTDTKEKWKHKHNEKAKHRNTCNLPFVTKAKSDRICSGMDSILYLINNTIPVVKSSFFKSVMETIFSSSCCNMFVLRFR